MEIFLSNVLEKEKVLNKNTYFSKKQFWVKNVNQAFNLIENIIIPGRKFIKTLN